MSDYTKPACSPAPLGAVRIPPGHRPIIATDDDVRTLALCGRTEYSVGDIVGAERGDMTAEERANANAQARAEEHVRDYERNS